MENFGVYLRYVGEEKGVPSVAAVVFDFTGENTKEKTKSPSCSPWKRESERSMLGLRELGEVKCLDHFFLFF